MRFFKAFNLLHRRTKSDTFVSGSSPEYATTDSEPPSRRSSASAPISLYDLVASQIPANFKYLNYRGSGSVALPISEKALNVRLIDANDRWAREYANLEYHLKELCEELHSERQKVQCLEHKLEEDNRLILDLRISLGRFERLCGVSNPAATQPSQQRMQSTISGGTGILLNVSTGANVDSFSNVMNIRTMDEYSSALRMTLATRKELRDQKKVALFWKRKALDANQLLQSAITPSVSTISSIHDPLPVSRQIALQALISRRGLDHTLKGQMGWNHTSFGPPKTLIPKLSTHLPADKASDPIASALLPAMSSENSRFSRLEPLASESIKAEINSLYYSPDSLTSRRVCEPSHSPSLIGRLTKFTFATSTPSQKTDLDSNVESFGDLHTIFATTFGTDKLLVDESTGDLNRIDMDDDLNISITSILPSPTAISVSSGAPTGSVFKTSNIPTRRGTVTSAGSHNAVTANTLKLESKDCTSRRPWQKYKAQPAISTKGKTVLEGSVCPKPALGPRSQKPARGKENNFARAIPIFKRKHIIQLDVE